MTLERTLRRSSSFSIRTKLFLLSALILVCSYAIMGYLETVKTESVIEGEALVKAQSDLQTGMEIINLKYPGPWHVEAGQLYKGDMLINDNHEIVDSIGKMTNGNTATIFLGDTRVTTNVIADGKRAVGTKISDEISKKVLEQGEIYLGVANVVGHTYQAAYMPIKDADGKTIGIWYVGAPDSNERVQQIKQDIAMQITFQAVIMLAISLALYYLLTRPIINRIQASAQLLQIIASGDLTQKELRVNSNDETGVLINSVNKMAKDIRTILTQVKDTSLQVAASSEQLSASTEQTSEATEQISLSIQEVASGSEKQMANLAQAQGVVSETSRGMDQASLIIQNMSDFSETAKENARFGTQTVSETIEQMNLIQQTVGETAVVIQSLSEKSQEIDEIVAVITHIANQTHLLALNAAIEAARAGEHGMGFAVVAAEVRKLADQSGRSAEEISELLGQVQAESQKAVRFMRQGTMVVEQGMQQVQQSGAVFHDIVSTIEEISSQSHEISAFVQQVHANSNHMVSVMEQVAVISQQSSHNTQCVAASVEEQNASMEEISASAAYLGRMAEELQALIQKFKV